jgi:hypothetical protein
LYWKGRLEIASRALEVLVDDPATPDEVLKNSLLQLIRIFKEMGLPDEVSKRNKHLKERFG